MISTRRLRHGRLERPIARPFPRAHAAFPRSFAAAHGIQPGDPPAADQPVAAPAAKSGSLPVAKQTVVERQLVTSAPVCSQRYGSDRLSEGETTESQVVGPATCTLFGRVRVSVGVQFTRCSQATSRIVNRARTVAMPRAPSRGRMGVAAPTAASLARSESRARSSAAAASAPAPPPAAGAKRRPLTDAAAGNVSGRGRSASEGSAVAPNLRLQRRPWLSLAGVVRAPRPHGQVAEARGRVIWPRRRSSSRVRCPGCRTCVARGVLFGGCGCLRGGASIRRVGAAPRAARRHLRHRQHRPQDESDRQWRRGGRGHPARRCVVVRVCDARYAIQRGHAIAAAPSSRLRCPASAYDRRLDCLTICMELCEWSWWRARACCGTNTAWLTAAMLTSSISPRSRRQGEEEHRRRATQRQVQGRGRREEAADAQGGALAGALTRGAAASVSAARHPQATAGGAPPAHPAPVPPASAAPRRPSCC